MAQLSTPSHLYLGAGPTSPRHSAAAFSDRSCPADPTRAPDGGAVRGLTPMTFVLPCSPRQDGHGIQTILPPEPTWRRLQLTQRRPGHGLDTDLASPRWDFSPRATSDFWSTVRRR